MNLYRSVKEVGFVFCLPVISGEEKVSTTRVNALKIIRTFINRQLQRADY